MSEKVIREEERLGTENLRTLFMEFWIPSMVGMLVSSLYNMVDRVFVAKGVGEAAFQGLVSTFSPSMITLAFSLLVGVGGASMLSIRVGEKDYERAEKIVGNSFTLMIILSFFIMIVGLIFLEPMLRIFGATDKTLDYAVEYMQVMLVGTIFTTISVSMNHLMRASGKPKLAMLTSIIGGVTNVVLDYVFIMIFKWGIFGAAFATIIAQMLSAIWIMTYFFGKDSLVKITLESMKLDLSIIKSILSIGISSFAIQIAGSVVLIVANQSLIKYGEKLMEGGAEIALASMGAIQSLNQLVLMPVFGINQGSQPIIGYNYGIKNHQRVNDTLKYSMIVATVILVIGTAIIFAIPDVFLGFFGESKEFLEISRYGIKIYMFMFPFIGLQIVPGAYYQATNRAGYALFFSMLRQVILLIPLYIILPRQLGLKGIWYASPISDFGSVIITVIVLYHTLKTEKRKRLEQIA